MCLKPYPQTILAICQNVENTLTLALPAPLQTKTRIHFEAQLYLAPGFSVSQSCITKTLLHLFQYLFQSPPQNPGSFFKNYPQNGIHIFSECKILEVCKKVYRNKFKYFKFMVKRDYIQQYTLYS